VTYEMLDGPGDPPWPAPNTLGVVVCAYTTDRWMWLPRCVRALAAGSRRPAELIVVVDHDDELRRLAERELGDVACVIPNCGRRGLSDARNTGAAAARADVVAFVDDDAVPAEDWAERVMDTYAPDVAGVGGAARPLWSAGRPPWFPREFDWVVGCSWTGLPETRGEVRNFIGANMSLRRSVIDDVGGFDSGLGRVGRKPVGCEETELCIRVRQAWPEARLVYDPRIVVDHLVPDDRGRIGYFVRRCWSEGTSKAAVARGVGRADGLASERRHVAEVLPRAIATALADGARRDRSGLARSAALVVGLTATVGGFGAASAVSAVREARPATRRAVR
jgi:GT2 family glycosyltransferase